MKKLYLYIFLVLTTNVNASDVIELLSNSPKSLDNEVFREIDATKAKKYKTFNIPYKANPDLNTLRYYFYRDLFKKKHKENNSYFVKPKQNSYEFEPIK